ESLDDSVGGVRVRAAALGTQPYRPRVVLIHSYDNFHTRRTRCPRLVCLVMSAILEIPEVRKRVSPLSVEEYHRLDEFNENGRRTELIRGIVIEKMAKSPLHSSISKLLYDKISAMVPPHLLVRREDPITLADRKSTRLNSSHVSISYAVF